MRFAPRAKLRWLCLVAAFGRGGPAGRFCSAGALRDVLAHALRDAFHGVLADGTLHNVLAHALRDALHGVLADGALAIRCPMERRYSSRKKMKKKMKKKKKGTCSMEKKKMKKKGSREDGGPSYKYPMPRNA